MAKKLISRQQQKPELKKIKKYSLAGYNLSGVSQAPQASYYLGQSAADAAGETQNVALKSLKETQDELKKLNEDQKKQQQETIKQSSAELGKLALTTGRDIAQNMAAKKAAELATKTAADQVAANTATTAAKEFGTNAMMAADTGADLASTGASIGSTAASAAPSAFMSGVASYGQPVSAALNIAGTIIKNTGSDDNAATFTQKERNRHGVGNIMSYVGQGAGYGSLTGNPIGTLVGAGLGLGYGIYDTIKDNKESEENAGKLAMTNNDPMAAANNAFIDSRMMDAYRGGSQMARYGGMKYAMGGPGDPIKGATTTPAPVPQIDFSNPGATLSINGVPAAYTPPPTAGPYDGMSRGEARDAYKQKKQQYNMDWAKARRVDIDSADPRTLQDRIPYPQMPYSPAEQRRVDAGKEAGTFFDAYQSDRTRPGTRMLNDWNNSLSETDQDLGFRQERPDYSEEAQAAARRGRSGVGNFFHDMFKEKPNYGGDHSTRTFKVDKFGQRKQDRDCRSGNCGPKKYGGYQYEFGGTYDDLGGTRYVDGGKIKPIPNSNDVEFVGKTHEQGGIKLDKYTEVEGGGGPNKQGETGTKINGSQYFFSRVLKTDAGSSYAEAHKGIAANPSLDPISKKNIIKSLAREQEMAAGRDPKQIARTGGMQEYAEGGKKKNPKKKKGEVGYNPKSNFAEFNPDEFPILPIDEGQGKAAFPPFKGKDGKMYEYRYNPNTKQTIRDPKTNLPIPFPVDAPASDEEKVVPKPDGLTKELLDYNFKPDREWKDIGKDEPPMDPKKLDLSKTWLEEHPGFLGGLAQLAGPAYAMLKPYQKTKGMAAAQSVTAPSLARVDKSGEIEDARRQQNAMNTYLKNTNLGPGKIIAMQSVASKTADEIAKISQRQDQENRAIKNAEAQIAAEVAGRNQAAQLETSKANMMADINQNQYMDERNLGVAEALGKGLAGMSMDQRKLDMQYKIARGLDKTGSLNRYEIMEQLRKQAKNPESPVYQKSESELQEIASELGYKVIEVVADDQETKKRLGGMGRKYTSRLGDLSTKRNTTAKKSI
jgi:hypothetical protein